MAPDESLRKLLEAHFGKMDTDAELPTWFIKFMICVVAFCFLVFGFSFIYPSLSRGEVVQRVIDGDTVVMQSGMRVRLACIDALELTQPGGRESKAQLAGYVLGKDVELCLIAAPDPPKPSAKKSKDAVLFDRYGRAIASIVVNGHDVGLLMVESGYAYAYSRFMPTACAQYEQAEVRAREAKRGFWGWTSTPPRPEVWRKNLKNIQW